MEPVLVSKRQKTTEDKDISAKNSVKTFIIKKFRMSKNILL